MSEKKPEPGAKPAAQKTKPAAEPPARAPTGKPDELAPEATPEAAAEAAEPADADASAWTEGDAAQQEAAGQTAMEEEIAELKDRVLRTHAEMENLRRRTEREKAETAKYAITAFARDVLAVGDNIARAIEAVPQNEIARDAALKALLEGVQMTDRELMNTLERHGIARLEPKGERFDPNRHQAMFEVENKDVPEGTIVEVMQAGYMIEDRILRPAMVGIAKGGEKLPKPETEAAPQAANDDTPADPQGDGPADQGGMGGTVDKSA